MEQDSTIAEELIVKNCQGLIIEPKDPRIIVQQSDDMADWETIGHDHAISKRYCRLVLGSVSHES